MDKFTLLIVLQLLSLNEAYNLTCPSQAHWNIRAKFICKPSRNYTCLFDVYGVEVYRESCIRPRILSPGYKYVFQPNLNSATCSVTRYQPLIFNTIGNSDCIYQKSLCNSLGQETYEYGNTTVDNKCICNTGKGYTFVRTSKQECHCNPSTDDCSCYLGINPYNKTIGLKDIKCYNDMHTKRSRYLGDMFNISRSIKIAEFDNYRYNVNVPTNRYRMSAALWVLILLFAYCVFSIIIVMLPIRRRNQFLSTPKKLDIVACTDCSVTIEWFIAVPDECISYELDHRTKGTDDWSTVTFLSKDVLEGEDGRCMYTLKNLLPKTYYEFKMRSVYKDAKSYYSESMTKQTLKMAPIKLDIVDCTDCSVTVVWFNDVPDECLSYELDHRPQGTDNWSTNRFLSEDVLEGEDGRRMYTLKNLLPKTYYEFKMRSVYEVAKSHYSESMTKQTLKMAPIKLDIVDCTDCSVTIVWFNDVPDECLSYELDHRPQGTDDWSTNTFLSEDVLEEEDGRRMYTLQNLLPKTYYEFKMRSVYKDAKSHYSESMTKQTLKMETEISEQAASNEIKGGSNKELIREAEVDIDKLPEIPVHEMSSTHEPDGGSYKVVKREAVEHGEDIYNRLEISVHQQSGTHVPDGSVGEGVINGRHIRPLSAPDAVPVSFYASTYRTVGSVGEGVINGRHIRPLSAPDAVPVSFYASTYRTVEVKYDIEAFPRLTLLLTRLNEFMDKVDTNVEQLPHIRFICDEQFASNLRVSSCRFAVHDIGVNCIEEQDVTDSWLTNTVCVIQPDESGNLTQKDKKVLEWLQKSFSEYDTKSVIFVINNPSCSSSMLETCSKEISEILERFSAVNTIFNRLFTIESSEISVRISLFFEKNLLDKFPLQIIDTGFLEKTLTTLDMIEFKEKLTAILSNSRQFMRRKTLECPLDEGRTDRLPLEIQICKNKVKNYVCECLSQDIAITLEDHLKKHLRANNIDFDDGFDNIMNRLIRRLNISISSIPIIFEPEIVAVSTASAKVSDMMFSVNVMDASFRHSIADNLHESIMTQIDEIIPNILQRLDEVFFKKVIKLCKVLNVFGRRNQRDVSFHAYKTITERNLKIRACGLFGNIVKVYIHNKEINEVLVRKYLCTYFEDISLVNICEYVEMNVSKHLFKSGNKVKLCINSKAHYGTVSFPMKDEKNRYYCATCRHVTVGSIFDIQTDDGNELPAEIHYRADELDFSLLKIKNANVVCHHGIRTEQNCFMSGEVLEYDMMPSENDSVYKWGATTNLTEGTFKGVICTRKSENGKYDIETFIIQGQNEQFSKEGDSGSLICIAPDSILYTSHMAAFILIGKLNNYEGINYPNSHICYRVSLPLMDMKKTISCRKIIPCFSM